MATSTDPREWSAQDEADFRDAMDFVQNFALPEDTDERCTFYWDRTKAFLNDPVDPAGIPIDLFATPTTNRNKTPVQIPVTVVFIPIDAVQGTAMGSFKNPNVQVTVFDTYYPQIQGAKYMSFAGNEYKILYVAPPEGLFGVTFYTIHGQASSES